MARKIINRKDKRLEIEAAEKQEAEEKKSGTKKKKAPAKRSRKKVVKEVRKKAFWGVFNQSLKQVAIFEYSERKEADKKAAALTASSKSPHFVNPVKREITE